MPFSPPFRDYRPGDLIHGPPAGRDALAAFVGATPPFTVEELAADAGGGAFRAALARHPKYAEALDASRPAEFRARQLAKAGLLWATVGGGSHVHFSLAGLDDTAAQQNVAGKSAEDDDPAGKFDPVGHAPLTRYTKGRDQAGSELRWLFRHRAVSAVAARVQFWRPGGAGFAPCPPPWEWGGEVAAAWGAYTPTRTYTDADYPPEAT